MPKDIHGNPVDYGDKVRVVRSDKPALVGLEGTVTFVDQDYLTLAVVRGGFLAQAEVAAANVVVIECPTIHAGGGGTTMATTDAGGDYLRVGDQVRAYR